MSGTKWNRWGSQNQPSRKKTYINYAIGKYSVLEAITVKTLPFLLLLLLPP